MFLDPNLEHAEYDAGFLAQESRHLRLPSEEKSNALVFLTWHRYSELQNEYLKAKTSFLKTHLDPEIVNLNLIWDGYGENDNAALTVFRHFDSATVVKGFVGDKPKTAWVIGYPLLERIHYLLVAGFDIFGNIGHQLNSRLYMDFLRMEAEFNFLTFLPKETRAKERDHWYRGTDKETKEYIQGRRLHFDQSSGIEFIEQKLNRLSQLKGSHLALLPQTTFVSVEDENTEQTFIYTLLVNTAHSNVAHLFDEEDQLIPEENSLTIVKGFLGAYPNAFHTLKTSQLDEFVSSIEELRHEQDYRRVMDRFGVRRTNPSFWYHSDKMHDKYHEIAPLEAALFDYNRLENR